MPDFIFPLHDGFTVQPLTLEQHRALVAELSDACRDFSELINGVYTGADEAVDDLFTSLPPGHTLADKIVWGIFEPSGRLAGVADLMRGYPDDQCLWIGLLMFRPERRGGGLGVAVLQGIADWALANGFPSLGLGVAEHNEPARRFWEKRGFVEFRRRNGVVMGIRTNNLIAMRKAIGTPPMA